jgi:hypothetical protein
VSPFGLSGSTVRVSVILAERPHHNRNSGAGWNNALLGERMGVPYVTFLSVPVLRHELLFVWGSRSDRDLAGHDDIHSGMKARQDKRPALAERAGRLILRQNGRNRPAATSAQDEND